MRKMVLLSILLLFFLSVGVVSAAPSQDIYVSVNGNDTSNTGANNNSAYATIAKGVSDVNESKKATIHLGAGTFTSDGNTLVEINKAHRSQGGSLTIIGEGNNKTFIDGSSNAHIFGIKADSIVKLVNITFINGKAQTGGAINNTGTLTIVDSIFENNYATSSGGAIYSTSGNLTISNSKFNNNSAGSGAGVILASSTLVNISNSSFTNNRAAGSSPGGALSIVGISDNYSIVRDSYFANNFANNYGGGSLYIRYVSLINNQIINSTVNGTGRGGAVHLSSSYLYNNTMSNCSAANGGNYIFTEGSVNANVTFADLTVNSHTATVTATVTDDMGNPIHGGSINFYIDGILLESTTFPVSIINGTATRTYTILLDNGPHILSGTSTFFHDSSNIKNGTLTVDIDRTPVFLYVSPTGSDETGNGSKDKPYLTISKAINEGFSQSYDPTIHILEGTYSGAGNTNITLTNIGVLSLIGEKYNKTIIDGENLNWIFKFDQYTQVNMVNLTITNGNGTSTYPVLKTSSDLNITDCIFEDNLGAITVYVDSSYGGYVRTYQKVTTTVKNLIFKNNQGRFYISGGAPVTGANIIDNSSFINNYEGALEFVKGIGSLNLTVRNSQFINNSGGAIKGHLTSINNTYSGNYGIAINGGGNSFNDKFIGNTASSYGGAVSFSGNITGATFINNTAGTYGGAIYSNNLTISNCSFMNNTAGTNGNNIYISGVISGVNLIFVGNDTVNINKITGTVTATVTDDKGNSVSGGDVSFYLNGNYIGRADVINGLATLTYIGFKNGTYTLTGTYSNAVDPVYTKNGVVKVAINELNSVEYYVSKSGNDTIGNGSKAKPFLTIQKALTAGFEHSRTIIIHLLEGIYSGLGNVNITLPGTLNITIVGEGVNKTIVDGEDTNWIFNVTIGDGLITLKDFQIINGSPVMTANPEKNSPIMIAANSTVIIRNMDFSNNQGYNGGAVNNNGNLTVYDSNFVNNGQSSNGGGIYNNATGILSVYNSSFLNGQSYSGGGIHTEGFASVYNSSFVNNTARGSGGGGTAITNWGDGDLFVKNSLFENNSFIGPYGNGRAIDGRGSTLNIFNSVFTNNGIGRTYKGDVYFSVGTIYNSTFYNSTGVTVGSGGNVSFINCSLTGIDKAITLEGSNINITISGCLFENNTYALYGTASSSLVDISNCVILDPVQIGGLGSSLVADYNWWGSNDKPVIVGPDNLTLEYWLVMTLTSDNKPGFSKNIKAGITHYTDGVVNYAFDGYLPVREYLFGVSTGTINPVTGNLTDNIVGAVFNVGSYGNHTVNVTIDNWTLTHVFELFQANSTTTVGLSNSTGKVGDKVVVTVEVKDENGDPIDGGEVEFFIGTKSIGKAQVVNGKAVKEWTVTGNSGACEINARYLGSDAYHVSDNYASFLLDAVAPAPKADVKGGSYNTTKKVTLTATDDQDSNPKIYYTIDGTTPTIKSMLYRGPISIGKTTILKFIAVDSAGNVSPVQTEAYIIDTTKPTVNKIDPANNATKIAAGKTIKVTFNEAIKKGSNFWIELKNSSGKTVSFTSSVSGKVLTVDPTGNLAESLYTLIIHTGAVTDMVGNPVALTNSKFSVGTSPKVISTDPKNNKTNVAAGKTIKVTFSEAIKKGGKFWVELLNSSKKAISFTSSIKGKVLTIKPKNKLAESKYRLVLHTGSVTDLAGNPLALKTVTFIVGTSPTVTKTDPKNGATKVAANKTIKVTFNENIKKGSKFWIELVNSSKKAISFTSSVSGKVLTIKPKSKLAESKYKLILHTGAVTDIAGNPVALKTITFSVGTVPQVTKTDPKNNAKNIARNKTIKLTFNENIKKGSNYWIELVASNGAKIAIKKSIKDKVLTITPTKTLKANTKYKLVLHTGAVTDLAGNPVALKTSNFTTRRT